MSKYDKLWKYIKDNDKQEYIFSYDDIKNSLLFLSKLKISNILY